MGTPISLCMIVKDEEANLTRCLDSVRDVVDEIVIVDTGSCDNTVSIANSYGAKIFFHAWEDDFSAPRNTSLEYSTGDWILILDADEVLAKESKPTLKELAQKSEIWGYYVSVQVHPDWTDNKSLRFFRHLPIFRFKGIFHEQLLKDCPESDIDRSKFVDSDIRIIHTSWRDEDNVKKRVRNISLLKKHLTVYPDDIYQMLDLVRLCLETTNLSGAEELLDRVHLLLQKRSDGRNLKQYQAYYFFYTLELFSKKGIAPEKILSVCEEALSSFPHSPLFLFYAALTYYKLKEYDKAGSYFRKCLILRENNSFDQTMIFPKDILGAKSLSGLGHCYFKKRDYSEALKFFQQSHLLQPENKIQAMIQASVSLLEKNRGKSD